MPPVSTRGAEGLDRRAFSVADVLRMQEAGIIGDQESFELVEGEIVPMHAKTHAHELIKSHFVIQLARALPDHLWLGVESTIYFSESTFLEPDIVIYPRGVELERVKGNDVLLAIEVAQTSLTYDRGVKAQLYARYGVRELWVIDAKARTARVHRKPSALGWGEVTNRSTKEDLVHSAVPGFCVRLRDI